MVLTERQSIFVYYTDSPEEALSVTKNVESLLLFQNARFIQRTDFDPDFAWTHRNDESTFWLRETLRKGWVTAAPGDVVVFGEPNCQFPEDLRTTFLKAFELVKDLRNPVVNVNHQFVVARKCQEAAQILSLIFD